MSETLLEVKDLEVYYGVICALKGISFKVNKGEIVSLIGANGAGKTTTLHTVTGLIKLTKQEMEKDKSSKMWELAKEKVSGRTAFDAMRLGDKTAKYVVDTYLKYVATGIVDVINMLQPEVLSIGGGISKEGDTLLNPIKEYVEKEMFSRDAKTKTRICIAELGNDAGIIGAANLGL